MRWVIVVFLFLLYIINYADKAIVGYSAESIMKDLALNYTEWGLVGSSFYWLFSIAGIAGAALTDKIGTKKMLTIMAIVWTICQLGAFAIYSLPLLIFSRVLLGAFEGPYLATAVSHISKWFPPERRAFAMSLVNCGSMGAKLMAPMLIAVIHTYSWRIGFGLLGSLSLIWVVLWLIFGRERPKNNVNYDEPRENLQKVKWTEISKIILSANFIFTTLAFFSAFWVLSWSFVWMPVYLTKIIHLSPMQMGYILSGLGIVTSLGSIAAAVLSDKVLKKTNSHRKSRVFVSGSALILAAICLFLMTVIQSTVAAIILLCFALTLVNTMFAIAPQIAVQLLPERKGLITGVLVGLANLAGIVGPLITGFVVQFAGKNESIGFNYSVMLAAVIVLITNMLFLIFTKPDGQKQNKDQTLINQVAN
ncbi:MFS transporter [Neobacillus mesonae]|uniref:MFS transporter n=1 Tax=Neobacillus mesonae TaxID=1193713 RepID=UPI00257224AF|nr:MFS transporter [Neobacillus mesonae]